MMERPCGRAESVRIKDHARGTGADGTGNGSGEVEDEQRNPQRIQSSSEIY
jgi:hypothetical protein